MTLIKPELFWMIKISWFKQLCLDPSHFLNQSMNLGTGAVLFSATLSPMDYYQNVLGGIDNSLAYQLPSPFPMNNQSILITQYVQTTYKQRQFSQESIIESMHVLVSAKKGNYLFFFPSYGYLQQLREAFEKEYPEIKVIVQSPTMDSESRKNFLAEFQEDPSETMIGFLRIRGIFSEGIDLKGSRFDWCGNR